MGWVSSLDWLSIIQYWDDPKPHLSQTHSAQDNELIVTTDFKVIVTQTPNHKRLNDFPIKVAYTNIIQPTLLVLFHSKTNLYNQSDSKFPLPLTNMWKD